MWIIWQLSQIKIQIYRRKKDPISNKFLLPYWLIKSFEIIHFHNFVKTPKEVSQVESDLVKEYFDERL